MSIFRRIKELVGVGYQVSRLNTKLNDLNERIYKLESANDDLKMMNARIYSKMLEGDVTSVLADYEFKVFSQFGDDGIIQYLIRKACISAKTFIEFGVENYREANTRFLLINNNWKGLIMDGSENHIRQIKSENLYWRQNLTAVCAFIKRENINDLLQKNGFAGEVGILHIDIDGNDYWIWNEINVIDPQMVIMEYNAVFALNPWTVPYDPDFYRTEKHHSNLYFGASLAALNVLAEKRGYSFVGCNSHGNNAYFIRNDKMNGLKKVDVNEGFVNSQFRESRDMNGHLTFISGGDRIHVIKGLPVYNVATDKTEHI